MTWTPWIQVYDPLASAWVSTAAAAFPIVLLLAALGLLEWRAHYAALAGLLAALGISTVIYGMPVRPPPQPRSTAPLTASFRSAGSSSTPSFFTPDRRDRTVRDRQIFGRPIVERSAGPGAAGRVFFRRVHRGSVGLWNAGRDLLGAAHGARLHAAVCGGPVAHCEHRAGCVWRHRHAILTLAAVTGIAAQTIGAMAGRQLPFFSLLVPAWLVVTMSGWRGVRGVWPAVLVCGGTFAIVQFLVDNFVGVELVDVLGGLMSIGADAVPARLAAA